MSVWTSPRTRSRAGATWPTPTAAIPSRATPKGKEGAPLHDAGKYLEILRRQSDGSWRYAVDMYSSDLPVPK